MKIFLYFFLLPFLALVAKQEESEEPLWDIPTVLTTAQDYYRSLQEAHANHEWWSVIDLADIIAGHFPSSPLAEETSFLIGEAYFNLDQLELANQYFTSYLGEALSPKHFEETLHYKFTIAEQFKEGAKKPLFGSHKMPKILSAKEDAIAIYEEIISTLPQSEMAFTSLLHKALLQAELEEYSQAQETLDLLIRRAPKHDLGAAAFLKKMDFFQKEAELASPDPNILELAEVALRKFHLAFPREPRLADAEKKLREIQSSFSDNLLTVGKFFEKTKKYEAAALYYRKALAQFPLTQGAEEATKRLSSLEKAGKISAPSHA